VTVLLVLLASLLVEIAVAVWVAQLIGFWWMALALVGLSLLGLFLLPKVGMQGIRRVQEAAAKGEQPGRQLVDGGLLMVAALLLLIPGFVTGAMGLVLLVPPVRHGVAGWWSRRIGAKVRVIQATYGGTIITTNGGGSGSVIDTSATDVASPPPSRPELPGA
jgi:UPF0716 protein FxsA